MNALSQGTVVLFPQGVESCTARVVHAQPAEGTKPAEGTNLFVVTDRTPFHPVDHTWPDQPGDEGTLSAGGRSLRVVDALTAASGPDGVLRVGAEIPVRRNEPGWSFLVVHVVEAAEDMPASELAGAEVTLVVDSARRRALSMAHTGCHLMSLALNGRLRDLWRKLPRTDCLGNPDFDQVAIVESRIMPMESVDRYRLGKSLRRAGFDVAALADTLESVREDVEERLRRWIEARGRITIETEAPELASRRWWTCELPDGSARIPCGGTHLENLGELASLAVRFETGEQELVVHTTAKQA